MALTLSGTAGPALDGIKNSLMSLATAQNTTSGTSIDFLNIPSWAKKITVILNQVSTNGTSNKQIQLGTSSGVETTGYIANSGNSQNGSTTFLSSFTSGVGINSGSASEVLSGHITLSTIGSNVWIASGILSSTSPLVIWYFSSSKTLSGTLDRVRITTVNGTDAFDNGSVNILIEGYV